MAEITLRSELSRNLTAPEVDANMSSLKAEAEAATAAIAALTTTVASKVGASDIVAERSAAVSLTNKTLAAPTITGVANQGGALIMAASAMSGNSVDVTKMANTKSISANTILAFSATPAADTVFGLWLTNTGATPRTITIPESFSINNQANVTSFVIPGNGELYLTWRYTGSGYRIAGDTPQFHKFDATAAPTVSDDVTLGYGAGSLWLNVTTNTLYVCESAATGAAVWNAIIGSEEVPPSIQFYLETVEDKTIPLLLSSPFPFAINDVVTQTEGGSCTCTVLIGSTPLGGTANAASVTEQTQPHTTANSVPEWGRVSLAISANAGATGLTVIINGTRA